MTKDEALRMALEALKQIDEAMPFPVAKLAQKAIREVLALSESSTKCEETSHAQPERPAVQGEPVACAAPMACSGPDKCVFRTPQPAVQGEPVGQLQEEAYGRGQVMWFKKPADGSYVYTTPQPAVPERKPLTDEFILSLHYGCSTAMKFARAIEAAHGIKGEA